MYSRSVRGATPASREGTAETGTEMSDVMAGSRFTIVGFDKEEEMAISEALSLRGSCCRSVDLESTLPSHSKVSDSDAVILNFGPRMIESKWVDAKQLQLLKRPVLAVGHQANLMHLVAAQLAAQEVMVRPFDMEELTFRAWRTISRPSEERRGLPVAGGRALSVLVVDDDPSITALVRGLLSAQHMQCQEANNGRTGLDMARTLLPDLIILDVSLPVMSGFDVLSAIRTDPSTSALRVLMLTGATTLADVSRGEALGVEGYICKPFRPFEFSKRVRELLREDGS